MSVLCFNIGKSNKTRDQALVCAPPLSQNTKNVWHAYNNNYLLYPHSRRQNWVPTSHPQWLRKVSSRQQQRTTNMTPLNGTPNPTARPQPIPGPTGALSSHLAPTQAAAFKTLPRNKRPLSTTITMRIPRPRVTLTALLGTNLRPWCGTRCRLVSVNPLCRLQPVTVTSICDTFDANMSNYNCFRLSTFEQFSPDLCVNNRSLSQGLYYPANDHLVGCIFLGKQ